MRFVVLGYKLWDPNKGSSKARAADHCWGVLNSLDKGIGNAHFVSSLVSSVLWSRFQIKPNVRSVLLPLGWLFWLSLAQRLSTEMRGKRLSEVKSDHRIKENSVILYRARTEYRLLHNQIFLGSKQFCPSWMIWYQILHCVFFPPGDECLQFGSHLGIPDRFLSWWFHYSFRHKYLAH